MIAERSSEQSQPETSISHSVSKMLQQVESNNIEEDVQSLFMPPSSTIVEHENFYEFLLFKENSVTLLYTYIYDLKSKKVSRKIIKRVKVQEEVMEK